MKEVDAVVSKVRDAVGRLVDVADVQRLFVIGADADWDVALEGVDEKKGVTLGVAV